MTTICFICSAARSGSTLLDMLIGGHSEAASLGEVSFLGKAIALGEKCSCGEKVGSCPNWGKFLAAVNAQMGINLLENPYGLWLWDTKAGVKIDTKQQTVIYSMARKCRTLCCDLHFFFGLSRYGLSLLPPSLKKGLNNSLYLYETLGNLWGKRVLVDSSKNVHKALAVMERQPVKTKIIYLTRDGRGVYYSRRSSGFSRKESVSGWMRYNKRATILLKKRLSPENLLVHKYEDIAVETKKSMRKVCDFLGIEFEPGMLELTGENRHLVNGNDTRLKKKQAIKLDERWKVNLDKDELSYFLQKAGSVNRQLGYL